LLITYGVKAILLEKALVCQCTSPYQWMYQCNWRIDANKT